MEKKTPRPPPYPPPPPPPQRSNKGIQEAEISADQGKGQKDQEKGEKGDSGEKHMTKNRSEKGDEGEKDKEKGCEQEHEGEKDKEKTKKEKKHKSDKNKERDDDKKRSKKQKTSDSEETARLPSTCVFGPARTLYNTLHLHPVRNKMQKPLYGTCFRTSNYTCHEPCLMQARVCACPSVLEARRTNKHRHRKPCRRFCSRRPSGPGFATLAVRSLLFSLEACLPACPRTYLPKCTYGRNYIHTYIHKRIHTCIPTYADILQYMRYIRYIPSSEEDVAKH